MRILSINFGLFFPMSKIVYFQVVASCRNLKLINFHEESIVMFNIKLIFLKNSLFNFIDVANHTIMGIIVMWLCDQSNNFVVIVIMIRINIICIIFLTYSIWNKEKSGLKSQIKPRIECVSSIIVLYTYELIEQIVLLQVVSLIKY